MTRTRLFILSAVHNLADKQTATTYLLENQRELADGIAQGNPPLAAQLAELLKQHILIAADVVANVSGAAERWRENAIQIANVLAGGANPAPIQTMMLAHLDATARELKARQTGDYAEDVRAFTAVLDQAQHMADMLV